MNNLRSWGLTRRPGPQILLPLGALALLVHGLILTPVWFPLQAVMGLIWAGVVPGALAVRLLLADDRALLISLGEE